MTSGQNGAEESIGDGHIIYWVQILIKPSQNKKKRSRSNKGKALSLV